jgi:hypothetical protein
MVKRTPLLLSVAVLASAGCGGSSKTAGTAGSAGSPAAPESAAALSADARSAATGDIPDTQNFLILKASRLRVSMLYPEGWTVRESASRVSIAEKNNLVGISVASGPAPTPASVQAQLARLARSVPGLKAGSARAISLASGPAVKVTYTTRSAPNPVTGKQVTLTVDRYALGHGGRVALVDLGTPVGVDNVDAYRRMVASFKWL